MKTAHGPLVQTSLYAPGREAARSQKRPTAGRPQTALHAPGRHVTRNRNWPIGPLAFRVSRAPGRNLGLGRESHFPPGPRLGPVIVSHPSESNGCARFSAEQNHADALAQTLALIQFSPLPLPCHSEQSSDFVGRRATQRERRERARGAALSPSPVCAPIVGWTRHRRVASVASLHVRAHRRGGESRLRRGFNVVRSSTRGAPARSWVRPHAN
jgi:hypothetical protein